MFLSVSLRAIFDFGFPNFGKGRVFTRMVFIKKVGFYSMVFIRKDLTNALKKGRQCSTLFRSQKKRRKMKLSGRCRV